MAVNPTQRKYIKNLIERNYDLTLSPRSINIDDATNDINSFRQLESQLKPKKKLEKPSMLPKIPNTTRANKDDNFRTFAHNIRSPVSIRELANKSEEKVKESLTRYH